MLLLGVSGSLRAQSTNSVLLAAAKLAAPAEVDFRIAEHIDALPHFNPDIDPNSIEEVSHWAALVKSADGLVISTPEYAGGYPGVLKNAFDWLVQTDAHIKKPFMLLNASGRSRLAQDTFSKVLTTMSGLLVPEASTTFSLLGKSVPVDDILKAHRTQLNESLALFCAGIEKLRQVVDD